MRLAPFRELLALPGGGVLAFFGLLGRAPMAMFSLGLVAAAASGGGDGYALGGAAAGAVSLAQAVAGPPVGRLIDRRGQSPLALWLSLACATSAAAIVISLLALGATILIVPLAALAGATQPAIGTYARARWAALLHGTPAADTAQALESINDEISFLVGPSLVAVLATLAFPGFPILVAAVLLVVGAVGMTSRLSVPPPPPHPHEPGESRWPSFPAGRGLLVATALLGIALGSVQVLQLAYCRSIGAENGAALVFFAYSAASLAGALVVGGIAWRTPARRRYTIALVGFALGIVPTALVSGFIPFVAAAAVAGVAIAPTFIQANAVVVDATPARSRVGAFSVLGSATILGIAAGAAIAGAAIDAVGPDAARILLVPLAGAAAVTALVVDLVGSRRVRAPESAPADGRAG